MEDDTSFKYSNHPFVIGGHATSCVTYNSQWREGRRRGKLGKMCPRRASGDRDGRSKSQVFVDVTMSPFGMVTMRGLVAMCLFVCMIALLP